MVGRDLWVDNLCMENLAGELASRLVLVFMRPSSLIICALVPLTLGTGLGNRVFLRIEEKRSLRSAAATR